MIKKAKQAVAKVPLIHNHLVHKHLEQKTLDQSGRIVELEAAVGQLQKRNDEWEKEVRSMRGEAQTLKIVWPVLQEDVLQADWTAAQPVTPRQKKVGPYTINWVVPPMGPVSGGHTSILRFVQHLESEGHTCRIYFYDPLAEHTIDDLIALLKHYPKVAAEVFYNEPDMLPCDMIFATSWHTAYPVFNYAHPAKKMYFVQDFEPFFDPVGSYSTLAENTYKFGLHGVTLGPWLAQKLSDEYGMQCDALDLGVDLSEYKLTNTKTRNKIVFYARPVTPRRGFELGVLALSEFHRLYPDYEIHFIGWDITPYEIPFPYTNHGILTSAELNKLYNESAAGLVLSFTNMSLLPLEMMASGCIPVVNDAKNTRMVGYASGIHYAETAPSLLAKALYEAATSSTSSETQKDLVAVSASFQWESIYARFDEMINRLLS